MKTKIFFVLLALLFAFSSCKEEKIKEGKTTFATTGDEVIDALTSSIEKDPLNKDLRYQRAQKYYEKEMYNECIEDLRVAITADSLKPEYYHLLADAFMDNQVSTRSLKTMEIAANLFPDRIPTLLKLSETQVILQQYDAAIMTINNIIKIDPNNAEAYFMLGIALRDKGEIKRAITAFQTATEMDAKLIDAWISLGNIYEANKNPKAEEYYKTAINIDPKNPYSQHALAYYYQNTDRIQQAIDIYKSLHVISPEFTSAYLNCGILYMEKDSLEKAYEEFNIMVGIDPKDFMAYLYRGKVNFALKKYENALADLRSSLNLNPDHQATKDVMEEVSSYIKK
jgi:tetratricopeptide (TPR) repeat protein